MRNKLTRYKKLYKSYISKYPNYDNLLDLLSEDNCVNKKATNNSVTIVFENNCDFFFNILFIRLIKNIELNVNVKCYAYNITSINSTVGDGVLYIFIRLFKAYVLNKKWKNIYKLKGIISTNSTIILNCYKYFKSMHNAYQIWNEIRHLEYKQLKNLTIENIVVGDLMVDTYLRFSSDYKFNSKNFFFYLIILQTIVDLKDAELFFERINPNYYFSSHATFIQHGIPIRIALKKGIKVRAFSNARNFYKEITSAFSFHTDSGVGYNNNKSADILKAAEFLLEKRVNGFIDDAILYMKKSAYSNNSSDIKIINNIEYVLFLHSFSDAPHCNPNFIFPDFWTWAIKTIDILISHKKNFAVKPHPNETERGQKTLNKLIDLYPRLKFLGDSYNNKTLVSNGMKLGITAYGTVAHELAYLGIPTLCCCHNPHHEFEFIKTAENIQEYEKLLVNFPFNSYEDRDYLKNEAINFYAAHNLSSSLIEQEMRDVYSKLHRNFDEVNNAIELNNLYRALENCQMYKKVIESIAST